MCLLTDGGQKIKYIHIFKKNSNFNTIFPYFLKFLGYLYSFVSKETSS